MNDIDLQSHQTSAARAGFINEMVAVQGHEPELAKKAYASVSAAGDKRAEKITTLAEGIKSQMKSDGK